MGYDVGTGAGVEDAAEDAETDEGGVELEDDEAIKVVCTDDVKVVDEGAEAVDVAGVEVELEDELASLLIDVDAVPLVLDGSA